VNKPAAVIPARIRETANKIIIFLEALDFTDMVDDI
jgi:hypothetical protein